MDGWMFYIRATCCADQEQFIYMEIQTEKCTLFGPGQVRFRIRSNFADGNNCAVVSSSVCDSLDAEKYVHAMESVIYSGIFFARRRMELTDLCVTCQKVYGYFKADTRHADVLACMASVCVQGIAVAERCSNSSGTVLIAANKVVLVHQHDWEAEWRIDYHFAMRAEQSG